jgi:hypothetical protein
VELTCGSSAKDLFQKVLSAFPIPEGSSVKLLYNGQTILQGDVVVTASTCQDVPLFLTVPKKTPKIMVLVSEKEQVEQVQTRKSDPTIRGFDRERTNVVSQQTNLYWGTDTGQDKNFKFCRFQACTWQSFGHRPLDSTPHDFEAFKLLEKLATDPGIRAIMRERELVVGTLGEMDPIDDRLMKKMQNQQQRPGPCLLGYNTNAGARIDIKLRTDDLRSFRSYPHLVCTLIHELSHNWCSEHDELFWANYGQMRVEYLYEHFLRTSIIVANGRRRTTAQIAEIPVLSTSTHVLDFVMQELTQEMMQHHLTPQRIRSTIQQRIDELDKQRGNKLGGKTSNQNKRDLALAAAEKRSKQQESDQNESNNS